MVENVFTFIEDQKLLEYVLSIVNVLFMLKMTFVSFLGIYELSPVIFHLCDLICLKIALG